MPPRRTPRRFGPCIHVLGQDSQVRGAGEADKAAGSWQPGPRHSHSQLHWLPSRLQGVCGARWGTGLERSPETETGEQREAVAGWCAGARGGKREPGEGGLGADCKVQPAPGAQREVPGVAPARGGARGQGKALLWKVGGGAARDNPVCL